MGDKKFIKITPKNMSSFDVFAETTLQVPEDQESLGRGWGEKILGDVDINQFTPYDQVGWWTDLISYERAVDVLTSATGMTDDVYERLVSELTRLGIGTEIDSLKMLALISLKIPADWSNSSHENAIVGIIKSALVQGGGPDGALRVIDDLSDFYESVKHNSGFNINEMMDILNLWQDCTEEDLPEIEFRLKHFQDMATRDLSDPFSSIGASSDSLKSIDDITKFYKVLNEVAEAPDASQFLSAQYKRSLNRMKQSYLETQRQIARREFNPISRDVEFTGDIMEGLAGKVGDFSNIGMNAIFFYLEPLIQAMGLKSTITAPGRVGGKGYGVPADVQPGMDIPPPSETIRASLNEADRFIREAQAHDHGFSGVDYDDYRQRIIEKMSAEMRELAAHNAYIQPSIDRAKAALEPKIKEAEGFINQYYQGLQDAPGQVAPAVTTPHVKSFIRGEAARVIDYHDEIISYYEDAIEAHVRRLERARATPEYKRLIDDEQYQIAYEIVEEGERSIAQLHSQMSEYEIAKVNWTFMIQKIIPEMEQAAIRVHLTTPAEERLKLIEQMSGGASVGYAQPVAAAIGKEIRELQKAKANLQANIQDEAAQVEIAKLDTKILRLQNEMLTYLHRAYRVSPATQDVSQSVLGAP